MRIVAIGFILLSTFLTVAILILYFRGGKCMRAIEGFADSKLSTKERVEKASASATNVLLDAIAKAKRVSTYVTNPIAWADRLKLATMTPIELARKHLTETANKPKV